MTHEPVPHTPGVGDHHPVRYPVAPKVKASAGGAGVGAALAAFLVWLADELWWGGENLPPEVPFPVALLIGSTVAYGTAFVSGYLARHQDR